VPASRVAHAELFKSAAGTGELDETIHNDVDKTDELEGTEDEEKKE
jgi:hypothetical protein